MMWNRLMMLRSLTGGSGGASSWNDLKDKPFWVDEKKILVVEGLSDNGYYNVQTTLEEGKEYTFDIDGVEYTGKCVLDDIDLCVYLPNSLNAVAIVYEYGISMRRENADTFHKIELVEHRVIHKLDAKYLPNSVWVEKNTRVILENQTVKGVFHLTTDTFFAEGETVTVVWDGVTYERVATGGERPSVGETAYLYDTGISGEPFAIECRPTDNDIAVFPCNDGNLETENTHTVSIYVHEEVVKTNCDFMVDFTLHQDVDGNDERDAKLISGDFAMAQAKILKGLPVNAFMRVFVSGYENGEPYKDVSSEVVNLGYYEGVDGDDPTATYAEFYSGGTTAGIGFSILPDGSLSY